MTEAPYDSIATDYQNSKELPFRRFAEAPLLMTLVGDVRGKNILDLACGEGIYSRKLMQNGAKSVLGVDMSSEMIALAKNREREAPLGIKYQVGDALTVGTLGAFDLVIGSYLLNYARTPEQLARFCRTIRANLKEGGRFVGLNDNPANDPTHYAGFRKYGFVKSSPSPRQEGDPITYTMYGDDGSSFSFDNYFLAPATYQRILTHSFGHHQWHQPKIVREGLEAHGPEFWREFEEDAPIVGIEAW